jgi:outer membrane biosynthesis protein TonB
VEEHEQEEIEHAPVPVLSPTALARRARLRRLVAGVVGFAGVISIAVVGKQVFASRRPQPPLPALETKRDTPQTQAPTAELPKAPADAKLAEPQKAVEPAKPEEAAKKDEAKPEETKKPEEAKKDEAKPEEAKKDEARPAPSGADAEALKKETLNLLNRGRTKDAIAKAQEAIAADPTDATSYLYLGSALQDTGKWKDGIEAYSECVRHATKGPVHECRAMGGHK